MFAVDVEGSVGVLVVMVNAWWEVRHCLLFFASEKASFNLKTRVLITH